MTTPDYWTGTLTTGGPLATEAELLSHLDAEAADFADGVVLAKLNAATALIEGPDGYAGRFFRAATVTARWYGLSQGVQRLALPVDAPVTPTFTLDGAALEATVGASAGEWYADVMVPSGATAHVEGAWTVPAAPDGLLAAAKEACLKATASLLADRTASARVNLGEGLAWKSVRDVLDRALGWAT